MVPVDNCFCMLTKENFPEDFCLNDVGLLLFTGNILTPVN